MKRTMYMGGTEWSVGKKNIFGCKEGMNWTDFDFAKEGNFIYHGFGVGTYLSKDNTAYIMTTTQATNRAKEEGVEFKWLFTSVDDVVYYNTLFPLS